MKVTCNCKKLNKEITSIWKEQSINRKLHKGSNKECNKDSNRNFNKNLFMKRNIQIMYKNSLAKLVLHNNKNQQKFNNLKFYISTTSITNNFLRTR